MSDYNNGEPWPCCGDFSHGPCIDCPERRPTTHYAPDDPRLARYGRTIWETSRRDEGTISATGANIVARAVMAVADDEIAELRAELDLYKRGGKTLGKDADA